MLAGELKVGDELLLQSEKTVVITELEWVHVETPVKVYNFEVRDWHTYFVSELDVLVHNKPMMDNVDPKRPIIIGENMERVSQYADKVGGQVYKPWKNDPFDFKLAMKRNKRWINDMMKEGRTIIDIGPDFSRRSFGRPPSPFYNLERSQTKGYMNYIKVFQRFGRQNGGVPGLDY